MLMDFDGDWREQSTGGRILFLKGKQTRKQARTMGRSAGYCGGGSAETGKIGDAGHSRGCETW
jgi:hypothetical protein